MTERELFDTIKKCEKLYNHMSNLSSSSSRAMYGWKIYHEVMDNSELEKYIIIDFNRRSWSDRFKFKTQNINNLEIIVRMLEMNVVVEVFDDGIDYTNVPDYAGLYFLGDSRWNPKLKRPEFWVKIGKSLNLRKRMRNYNTCCPVVWHIDFNDEYANEEYYHERLLNICTAKCNHNNEWFMVDEQTYNEMCKKGFTYFN